MSESYVLYQYPGCPFCRRVRAFLEHAGMAVEMRDTMRDPEARRELVEGGGRPTVPCLRIERDGEVRWLYESLDIIDYLARARDAQTQRTQ
ncbi:MAG: glutaredoxin family protein [Pseudomonadota bacterium]